MPTYAHRRANLGPGISTEQSDSSLLDGSESLHVVFGGSELKNGYGVSFFADGKIEFSGMWKDGKRCGQGTSFSNDGFQTYTGLWKDDKRHGRGISYQNGVMLEMGTFIDGLVNGPIQKWNKEGYIVFKGDAEHGKYKSGDFWSYNFERGSKIVKISHTTSDCFVNDLACGPNVKETYEFASPANCVYEYRGEMVNGVKHGKGLLYENFALIYDGYFENGLYHGTGKFWVCRPKSDPLPFSLYQGQFENGLKNGYGVIYEFAEDGSNPKVFDGIFKNDVMHGECILRIDNGYCEGNFVDGEITSGTIRFDDDVIYIGDIKKLSPYGQGKCIYDGYEIESSAWDGTSIPIGSELTITWTLTKDNGSEVSATMCGKLESWNADKYMQLYDATEKHDGVLFYQGRCRLLDCGIMEDVQYFDGIGYRNGLKRYEQKFVQSDYFNGFRVVALYDEKGNLALTIHDEDSCIEIDCDSEWPTEIEGKMNVHDPLDPENVLYVAIFKEGSIRNIAHVCNSVKIIDLPVDETLTDYISLDSIKFGTICYAFNSLDGNHLVTAKTLAEMRAKKSMNFHPMTRTPIMRIFRVRPIEKI